MGSSRNGTSQQRPQEGERGISGGEATSYLDDSLFRYGGRRRPAPGQLDAMLRFDPWAFTIEEALTWPVRAAQWSIEPAEGDTGEAEEATRQFAPVADRAVAGTLAAVCRRVAYAEMVWDYSPEERRVILADLAFRPIEQCTPIPDKNNRIIGFKQRAYAPGRGAVNEDFLLAERKAFVFLHDSAKRPGTGSSVLEAAYQHYEDKQKVLFYRFKSLEKYGGPSTHGKTSAAPNSDERRSFEEAVRDARSGASIVTGPEDEILYLAPPNAGVAFRQTQQDLNFEMAVSGFVQFLGLAQHGNSGAYALSRDHSDFLTIITGGRMGQIADAFTQGPVHDITYFNHGSDAAFPTFKFEPLSDHVIQRVLKGAEVLFGKLGAEMPDWLKDGIVEGYARSMGIEKPKEAETVGEATKATNRNSGSRSSRSDEEGDG